MLDSGYFELIRLKESRLMIKDQESSIKDQVSRIKAMRLLCITDNHSNLRQFEKILANEPKADLLIIGGDFTNFGQPPEVDHMLDLAQAHTPQVLAVAGNCDSAEIDRRLIERGVSLHARGVRIGDLGFFGVSAMPPWREGMYHFTEEELDVSWRRFCASRR
jgi:Icc-related predicted phosphoesterase